MSLHPPNMLAPTPTPPTSRTLTADGAAMRPATRASSSLDERDEEASSSFPPSLRLLPPLARSSSASSSVSSISSGTFHSLALTPPPTHARPGLPPRASSFHSHAFGTSGSASSIFDGAEATAHTNTRTNNAAPRFDSVRPPFGTRASSFHSHAFGAAGSAPNSIYSPGGTPPVGSPEAGCDAAYGLGVVSDSSLVLAQSVDTDAEPALAHPPSEAALALPELAHPTPEPVLPPAGVGVSGPCSEGQRAPASSAEAQSLAKLAPARNAPHSSTPADGGVDPADVHGTVPV
ncbi:hypothetical protein B0H15DRAFT_863359 [Mycena belliarum]|uniref:Uncharacterized protein n=1 Tax=Mycena belliarum TaxID=1033014 RepID=A0AAD6TSZ1_9AGAR|nr:hypothetical protein B0H15DRAFT_863359 [Mycena belliae]